MPIFVLEVGGVTSKVTAMENCDFNGKQRKEPSIFPTYLSKF